MAKRHMAKRRSITNLSYASGVIHSEIYYASLSLGISFEDEL